MGGAAARAGRTLKGSMFTPQANKWRGKPVDDFQPERGEERSHFICVCVFFKITLMRMEKGRMETNRTIKKLSHWFNPERTVARTRR